MELSSFANYELGETFFALLNTMLVRDGIPFPTAEDFDLVSPKWRILADKENKTPEEMKKLDDDYKMEIQDLADSCILYMGNKVGNKTYLINVDEYKTFIGMVNRDKDAIPNDKATIEIYDKKIENQFLKIANHGEQTGDNLIDNRDFAAFLYALDMKVTRDTNNKFEGFILNGKITPLNYAMAYKELKDPQDNMISLKLRQAYRMLYEN